MAPSEPPKTQTPNKDGGAPKNKSQSYPVTPIAPFSSRLQPLRDGIGDSHGTYHVYPLEPSPAKAGPSPPPATEAPATPTPRRSARAVRRKHKDSSNLGWPSTPPRRSNGALQQAPNPSDNHRHRGGPHGLGFVRSDRDRDHRAGPSPPPPAPPAAAAPPPPSMSGSMAKWREEQILIVCPGSRTTMAQLGCSELTPPTHRIPTRMFRDGDEWRPYHTYKRTRVVAGVEHEEWVEDVDEDEGAVWPLEGGRIVQMEAFLAFLDHVHSMLTTTYHNTPIMLMASSQWTRPDCEAIAKYIFEKTRTPALCMIHSAIATQYGLKSPHMTVVDIGYEKVDVTAIYDGRVVGHIDLGAENCERHISGGEVFTKELLKLLKGKGFNHDMAEQLKRSAICEVLPYATAEKTLFELPRDTASTGAPGGLPPVAAPSETLPDAPKINEPAKASEEDAEEGENGEANGDDEGILDVATIVTSGQTKEFLAKKEKEKEKEKGKQKGKLKDGDGPAARSTRLPNSKRTHNTFFYEEIIQEDVPPEPKGNGALTLERLENSLQENQASNEAKADGSGEPKNLADTENKTEANGEAKAEVNGESTAAAAAPPTETAPTEGITAPEAAAPAEANGAAPVVAEPVEAKDDSANEPDTPERRPKRIRRDVEVGLERFTFADRSEIDRIVSAIYRTVQGIDDMYMRPPCWDNLVFVGNGARLRGLRDNVLQTLNARHLISPSTATMFTSELPSNMATPSGTGSQTPTGSYTGAPHQLSSSGVNPLLQAATTASSLGVAAAQAAGGQVATPQPGGSDVGGPAAYHFHSQTPTSIKTLGLPTYLGEWTKNGFEEAMFLGAQVASRIAFCLHSGMDPQSIEAQRLMSLSRVDYNELGPKAIRTHSMLS